MENIKQNAGTRRPGQISRRDFLMGTTALSGAAIVVGCSKDDGESIIYSAPGESAVEERLARVVCRTGCAQQCSINVTLRNNRVVKASRAPMPNRAYDRMCLRGLSNIQKMYGSDRLLYPLKRVDGTPRGGGQWERISWSKAIEIIAEQFTRIQTTYGQSSLLVSSGFADSGGFDKINRLSSLLRTSSLAARSDVNQHIGMQRALGTVVSYPSMSGNEPCDIANAKTILCWGCGCTDSEPQAWHFIADAMEHNNAKLIVVDVAMHTAAARATHFVHVRPGSDTLLALSMIYEIMQRDDPAAGTGCWVNYDFMEKNTVAPFLVNTATGSFLRFSDLDTAEQALVYNAAAAGADSFIAYTGTDYVATVKDADLIGADGQGKPVFPANGICVFKSAPPLGRYTVKTAYEMLKDHVANYPSNVTKDSTGVEPAVTAKMAEIYATNGPAVLLPGLGIDHYSNGHHFFHAAVTIAAITGQIGRSGASIGNLYGSSFNYWMYSPNGHAAIGIPHQLLPVVMNLEEKPADLILAPGMDIGGPEEKFMGKPLKIRGMWIVGGNPVGGSVGSESFKKILTAREGDKYKVEFVLHANVEMSDTARYSDIVLPAAHNFEKNEIAAASRMPYMTYSEKVHEPIGECKTDFAITRLMADALGFGSYFSLSDDEFMETLMDATNYKAFYKNLTGKEPAPEVIPTLARLKTERAVHALPLDSASKRYIYPMHRKKSTSGVDSMVFGTQMSVYSCNSKRIEFYTDSVWVAFSYGQVPAGQTKFTAADIGEDRMKLERLPGWEEPVESWPGKNSSYPLQLFNEKPRWRVHTSWAFIPWLRELDPYPTVIIHKNDAEPKGIKTGDTVRIFNARGSTKGKAVVTTGIRPGVIRTSCGWAESQYEKIFGEGTLTSQCLTNTYVHPVTTVAAYFDTNAQIEKIEEQ